MHPVTSPRRLGRVGASLLFFAGLLLATACTPVLMVGDSVMVGAGPVASQKFEEAGAWSPRFDGEVGRRTDEGLEVIRALVPGYEFVVVELGYNDAWHSAYRTRIRAILDELSGRQRVVLVNMAEVQSYYVTGNQILREEAAGRDNVRIADWASVVATTSGLTASDGIHLTTAGNNRMAQLIFDTVTGP